MRRSLRSSPSPRSTTTSCEPAPAPGSAWSSNPAIRARPTISVSSSGMAPAPSIPTSRSRRSTTSLGVIAGPTDAAEKRYRTALLKGVIKAISRMGISTVQSYHGAQVFEAIGLNRDFIDEYFTWTPTRIGGIGIEVVSREVKARQDRAYSPRRPVVHPQLGVGGQYQYLVEGETHLFNPLTITTLQRAVRTGDYATFKDYTSLVDDQSKRLATLRGLMELRPALRPVPLDEVESVEAIVRRFKTGAMSYGSISAEAHEALAIAMNRLGGKSNTGEGGEDPARYAPMDNG